MHSFASHAIRGHPLFHGPETLHHGDQKSWSAPGPRQGQLLPTEGSFWSAESGIIIIIFHVFPCFSLGFDWIYTGFGLNLHWIYTITPSRRNASVQLSTSQTSKDRPHRFFNQTLRNKCGFLFLEARCWWPLPQADWTNRIHGGGDIGCIRRTFREGRIGNRSLSKSCRHLSHRITLRIVGCSTWSIYQHPFEGVYGVLDPSEALTHSHTNPPTREVGHRLSHPPDFDTQLARQAKYETLDCGSLWIQGCCSHFEKCNPKNNCKMSNDMHEAWSKEV